MTTSPTATPKPRPMEPPPVDMDVIVVGAGPAGMSAALLLGRQRRMTLVIDSGDYRNAPSPAINMLPSSNHILPTDYHRSAVAALEELDSVIRIRGHVENAKLLPVRADDGTVRDGVQVTTADGRTITAHRLIIATGQHDQLNVVPGASELWGSRVLHCPYCHGWEARDSRVIVIAATVGEDPTAPLIASYQALYINERIASAVTFVTPEVPNEEFARCLDAAGVTVVEGNTIRLRAADASTDGSVAVTVAPLSEPDSPRELTTDYVFMIPPTTAGSALGTQLGLEMQGPAIVVDQQQRTSAPVVFAAGDGCVPRGMPQPMTFVAQAQAHGQLAGLWADQDLFFASPTTPAFPKDE